MDMTFPRSLRTTSGSAEITSIGPAGRFNTALPDILVETGFISNPEEEMKLANAGYQTKLTEAMFKGIKRYFADYPPAHNIAYK